MPKYIDKSILITEIEKLISNGKLKYQQSKENNDQVSYIAWSEHIATCGKILCLLNTLETKEMDLKKEFYDFLDTLTGKDNGNLSEDELFRIAEYFYELGLTQKEE